MKKLLIISSLFLMLTWALFACDNRRSPEVSTDENITIREPLTETSNETSDETSESLTDASDDVPQIPTEEVTAPNETLEPETMISVVFGDIYTNTDKGTRFDGQLTLEKDLAPAYFGGVSKGDWMEFKINAAATGEYNVCMVFGGKDHTGTYVIHVDGYKAATIQNKITCTDPQTPTDSTFAKINLTEGEHIVRVVIGSNAPNLYGVKISFARENIALDKPISSDSEDNPLNGATLANDGDDSTRWSARPQGEANLIIDLKDLYVLDKIGFLFENSMGEYSISVSDDGQSYTLVCNGVARPMASTAFIQEYHMNGTVGRYIKISHVSGENTTDNMFSLYEIYLYGEIIVIPPKPVYHDDYKVPHSHWNVSGHCSSVVGKEGHTLSGMVAAGGVDAGALLHQGAVSIGKIDLSKYAKVIVYYGLDNSGTTQAHYNTNPHNRIILTKVDTDGNMSPEQADIIASVTYQLNGWSIGAIEIDLTGINYNGPVYVTYDTLPGTFMLIGGIEFIGGIKK